MITGEPYEMAEMIEKYKLAIGVNWRKRQTEKRS